MICQVYRSDTKEGLYLYLSDNEQIEDLQPELLKLIGKYTHVMELDLNSRSQLAQADIEKVKQSLSENGYYLQFPSDPVKNVLKYT